LFAGMFFTSVDLFPDQLPQLYKAPDALDYPRVDAMPRRTGRVLLSAGPSDDSTQGAGRARELERRDLLVVTLLDHLISQLGNHASPSLFGRVCRKLTEMNVLKGCDFLAGDGGLDAVRVQYMEEFAELNDVFVKDSENVRMGAEFTFQNNEKEAPIHGNALAKAITSAPPRPPTMPLPGRPLRDIPVMAPDTWESLGLEDLMKWRGEGVAGEEEKGKEWRMLCPEAQMLLIADKPANADMSIAARLSRKQQKPKQNAPRLLNNATASDDKLEHDKSKHPDQHPLSMILPRRAISESRFAKMLPTEESRLIELQCHDFNVLPLFPPAASAAVATV
jgi:hypothetical protein